MRIVQVHNSYRSSQVSGENVTVDLVAASLRARGHEVISFRPTSDSISGLRSIREVGGPFGRGTAMRQLRDAIKLNRPDVALVHNVYPLIGPQCISELADHGIPVAHVIHNYRHTCIAGTHWRQGAACDLCDSSSRKAGIIHGCYRGSRAQSALLTAAESFGAAAWGHVTLAINLSQWMLDQVKTLPAFQNKKSTVIHDPVAPARALCQSKRDFLYVGRLSEEKGVRMLLKAWAMAETDWTLHIAGAGPLDNEVRQASRVLPRLEFHGEVPATNVEDLRERTSVACVPALWNEPYGRVVVEAYASGQSVLATKHGALPELIAPGLGKLLDDDVTSWVLALSESAQEGSDKGPADAVNHWRSHFSPEHAGARYETALASLI